MTMLVAPWLSLLDRLHWTQQYARRNAMIASTALAQRRAELREVQDYLERTGIDAAPTREAPAARVI